MGRRGVASDVEMNVKETFGQRCRAAVVPLLGEGEQVIAEGRGAYLRRGGWDDGSTYEYLFVTDSRVLWMNWFHPRQVWSLSFDLVTGFAEKQIGHRYGLYLNHSAVTRTEWATKWRFLWWTWGNADKPQLKRDTSFMFSRRDTKVAAAIRAELSARGIVGRTVFPSKAELRKRQEKRERSRAITLFRVLDEPPF